MATPNHSSESRSHDTAEPSQNTEGNYAKTNGVAKVERTELPIFSGLAADLEAFIREREADYRTDRRVAAGADEYFFEIEGLPEEWDETKELELSTQDCISVHRRSGEFAFWVSRLTKKAREEYARDKPAMVQNFKLRYDGSVADFRDNTAVRSVEDGTAFEVFVTPGSHMKDYPSHTFNEAEVHTAAKASGEQMIKILMKCGTLVNITRHISLSGLKGK